MSYFPEVTIKDEDGEKANITNNALDVNIQDQHTKAIIVKFNQVQNSTTLAANTAVNDKDIVVTSAAGITIGSYIILFNVPAARFMFAYAINVVGTTITLDTPLDYGYPIGTYVDTTVTNMSVDGSVTTQAFGLRGTGAPPGVDITVDIVRLIFSCITVTAIDLSLFGDLPKLLNGLVLRRRDGTYDNIFNVKDNGELAGIMFDFAVSQSINPAQGQDGFVSRLTFGGQNKIGVTIRLEVGEDLEFLIQDDISGLTKFEVVAEGHIVEN